jgi:hypothetical protein
VQQRLLRLLWAGIFLAMQGLTLVVLGMAVVWVVEPIPAEVTAAVLRVMRLWVVGVVVIVLVVLVLTVVLVKPMAA